MTSTKKCVFMRLSKGIMSHELHHPPTNILVFSLILLHVLWRLLRREQQINLIGARKNKKLLFIWSILDIVLKSSIVNSVFSRHISRLCFTWKYNFCNAFNASHLTIHHLYRILTNYVYETSWCPYYHCKINFNEELNVRSSVVTLSDFVKQWRKLVYTIVFWL